MSRVLPDSYPSHWGLLRFDHIFGRSKEANRPDSEPLSVFLEAGVVPRRDRDDNHNQLGADLSKYLVVRPGDLVFNKLRTWQGGLGVSKFHGIVSPAYFVCRPVTDLEPRYYHYTLRSSHYLAELTRVSKFMPPSQFDIAWDDLRCLPLPLPPLEQQRAIADYLDAETARIDALITKKQRLIELLEERFWVQIVDAIGSVASERMPLRRVFRRVVDGPFGSSLTSAHYVERPETRVVRLGNIGFAEFRDDDRAYISREYGGTLGRHRVKPGGLLIAGLGDARNHVGRACVAPPLGDSIVKADCYFATLDSARAHAGYLAWYLSSPLGAAAVASACRGTTRSRINLEIINDVIVALPGVAAQARLSVEAAARRASTRYATAALTQQIALLRERRQAVITAAVTGELDIPAA